MHYLSAGCHFESYTSIDIATASGIIIDADIDTDAN
jgi:hypothetical protein